MSFLDWLRGGPKLDGNALREQLFAAAARDDQRELARLCKVYEHQILDTFPDWKKVPAEQRDDMGAVQRWGHGLMAVARYFAEELSQPDLIVSLEGKPEENPLLQWQRTLEEAQNLMREGNFRQASEMLAKVVVSVQGLRGSGVDQYLPVTFGMLGECCFQLGDSDRAVGPIKDAVTLCEKSSDTEGMLASLSNLYEVHRWRGEAKAAAEVAEKLAETLDLQARVDEARRYKKLAGIVLAGEPLVRVIAVVEGHPVEIDELAPRANERVQFVFERNRIALRPAIAATQRGEQLASAGQLDLALEAFRQAAGLDRFDPQPHYLEGLTLMHLKRYGEAVEAAEQTEQLAPGWFHCRAQAWLAAQLAAGKASHDAFLALRELEDGASSPEQQLALAEQMLRGSPELAPLHLAHGNALLALRRPEEARAAFRRGLSCAREPDVTARLRLRLALSGPPDAAGHKLLEAAQDPRGNLVAAAMAAVALRSAPR